MSFLGKAVEEARTVFDELLTFEEKLGEAAHLCVKTIEAGNKILICGNGGSACEAQHLAGELAGRYKRERRALPAIALNTDGAVMTCIGNDYSFDQVFSRQIEAFGRPGDLLIVFTTSGNSPNILRALSAGRELGIGAVAFLGRGGGKAVCEAGLCFVVPHTDTARIQEAHQLLLHCLVDEMEARLFGAL